MNEVLRLLQKVIIQEKEFIALHEPHFSGNESKYVLECIESGWVSSVGAYVDRFEQQLQEFTGVKRAVVVVNGTAALHMSLLLAGVVSGDEVLIPALTFVATANAVRYCGATPHLIDSQYETLGVDPIRLADYLEGISEMRNGSCFNKMTGQRIKAVVPMHTFGHPIDIDPLIEVCLKYRIELVEDAAESLGSYYKGRHTGSFGKVSALSFNGNKIVTTGGGGAILTNDEDLGKRAKHMTTTAKIPHKWRYDHDIVGYNYRMPNLNAALGCAQLEQLPSFLEKKRRLAERYEAEFSIADSVRFFKEPAFARSNYWLNTLLVNESELHIRDSFLEETNSAGYMTRPAWTLMSKLPMYQSCPRMELPVAEDLENRIINIPSGVALRTN